MTGVTDGLPEVFMIGNLLDDRLRLLAPLGIHWEKEGEHYIASCEEFAQFGYGDDALQAVDDLRQSLAELYWTLKSSQRSLSKGLAQIWEHLQEVIQERI